MIFKFKIAAEIAIKEKAKLEPEGKKGQPRIGKMRVTCSKGMASALFFFSSGWLNSLRGRTISWPLPWPFSRIHPLLATCCSRNLSRVRPSMLIACNKHSRLQFSPRKYKKHPNLVNSDQEKGKLNKEIITKTSYAIKESWCTTRIFTQCTNVIKPASPPHNLCTDDIQNDNSRSKHTSASTDLGTFW